jgi:hypothetical protein
MPIDPNTGPPTERPPLLTASWLRDNHHRLDRLQLEGETCVYCSLQPRTMVPVGFIGTRQLYACLPACEAAHGPDRP